MTIIRYSLFVFIPIFFSISLQSQSNQEKIDSLWLELGKAETDEDKAMTMASLSFIYYYSNPEKGLRIAKEAKELGVNTDRALFHIYSSLAANYLQLADYSQALESYMRALSVTSDTKVKAYLNGNIGVVYMYIPDNKKAEQHLKKAIHLATLDSLLPDLYTYKVNLANLYVFKERFNEAIEIYWEAFEFYKSIENEFVLALILSNISNCLNETDRYKEALPLLYNSKNKSFRSGNLYVLPSTYINLGNAYLMALKDEFQDVQSGNMLKSTNFIKAELNLDSAYVLSDQFSDNYAKKLALKGKSELYEFSGIYSRAYDTYKEYVTIKDSIFNQEKTLEIARIESQQEIELLKLRETAALEKAEKQKIQKTALGGILGIIIIGSFFLFHLYKKTRKAKGVAEFERKRSEDLLLNILPAEVAQELKNQGNSPARKYDKVSILFTDFVNFTTSTESMSPDDLVKELDVCFSAFDKIMEKHGLEKIKTIGDAYLAVSGLPVFCPDHALKCCKAALEIREFIKNNFENGGKFQVRIGVHSGPVIAGIVGLKKYAYDIWGDTVNFAARMEQNSLPGQITISEETYQLVSEQIDVTPRGELELKNKGKHKAYFLNALKLIVV